MRIRGVLVRPHHGRVDRDQPLFAESAHDELLDIVFRRTRMFGHGTADLIERLRADPVHHGGRLLVEPVPFLADHRDEQLDQIGRRDDLVPQPLDQLHRPGIDHADIGNVVLGGVLHGDPFLRPEHLAEPGMQFLPGEVHGLFSREVVELLSFHDRHQLSGLAPCRDEIVPPPAVHLLEVEPQHAVGKVVAVPEIAQQPAVHLSVAQRLLDPLKVHDVLL